MICENVPADTVVWMTSDRKLIVQTSEEILTRKPPYMDRLHVQMTACGTQLNVGENSDHDILF
jgi:hypothetical protein